MHDRLREWEARGHYLSVGDRRVFTWETGEGRPLVALHGFPASSYDWRLVADRLPGRRFVALDFFGFGLSDKSPGADYSLFGQAHMVEEVLAQLEVDRCDLVAHDMGDSVAADCRFLLRSKSFEGNFDRCSRPNIPPQTRSSR
ncbi:MAG: alpha/beta fold hydrolase [Actinomycetota bacterium]|nr:alpha/beta fold hydrolase [Actinomycetota bacterium]